MLRYENERLLILANTYPLPSTGYRETNCVAAVNDKGQLRRIFPVPYRLMADKDRFSKWEWIIGSVAVTPKDHRPESRRIDIDNIQRLGEKIPTDKWWGERLRWLQPHVLGSFDELETRRQISGETIGALGPVKLLGLDIVAESQPEWTDDEIAKLSRDGLFDSAQARSRPPLRKVPYRFYYRYSVDGIEHRHLITDWEAGTLYWNCVRSYGSGWEEKFRAKLEDEFSKLDLFLLLGTVHRFPEQWLIISLIYPPKGATDTPGQMRMDF